jgi:hypothetical protein
MSRFQTLLSNSSYAATQRQPHPGRASRNVLTFLHEFPGSMTQVQRNMLGLCPIMSNYADYLSKKRAGIMPKNAKKVLHVPEEQPKFP